MLNMEFERPVVIDTNQLDWQPSPRPGVWRKLLAREEAERGHATSIVRYNPGSAFTTHGHPLGEEILVLEGTFSDEHGRYPSRTWLRSPHLSQHTPYVEQETVIWVKVGHLPV